MLTDKQADSTQGSIVSNSAGELRIGNPEQWQRFVDRFPVLVDELPKLVAAVNGVFNRAWTGNSDIDVIVFTMGMLCWEDFEDIFILVANGRGFGTLKILRGMYERLVTLAYLQKHPNEAKAFTDYEKIRNYKLAQEAAKVVQSEDLTSLVAERKTERDSVRENFMKACSLHKDCDHIIEQHSWTRLGIPDLAAGAGDNLRNDLLVSYLIPLTETHPTYLASAGRQSVTPDGSTFENQGEKSREAGNIAFLMAYKYALMTLQIQLRHFTTLADLESTVDELGGTFKEVFKNFESTRTT